MEQMTEQFSRIWRSERLVYRGMEETEECKDLIHHILSDPIIYGLSMPTTQKPSTKSANDKITSDMVQKSLIAVLICLPEQGRANETPGKPIGYIQMSKRLEHAAMISLCLYPEYQDKGYGREAIDWMLDWAFRYGGLHRVAIGTVSYNERALHLYRKIGFTEEGRQRDMVYIDRNWYDLVEFGMLEDEWVALRK